ncbi:MAG: hypothetical protein ABF868_12335 [Sporolactobacillus sp.]
MSEDPKKQSPVTVFFNGEKLTLEEWTRRETAAGKQPPLDWSSAFPKKAVDKPAPHSFDSVKSHSARFTHGDMLRHCRRAGHVLRLLLLPAGAAILIGLAIGLTLLLFFSGQSEKKSNTWVTEAAPTAGVSAVTAKQLTVSEFLLQSGVYSNQTKAQQAAAALRRQGLAVVTGGSGQTALFIAGCSSAAAASEQAAYYKKKQVPVYQKQVQFIPSKRAAVLSDPLSGQFAAAAHAFILKLIDESTMHNSVPSVSEQTLRRLTALDTRLQQTALPVRSRRLGTLAANLKSEGLRALTHAEGVLKQPTDAHYAAFQQSVLNFTALYQDFIQVPR